MVRLMWWLWRLQRHTVRNHWLLHCNWCLNFLKHIITFEIRVLLSMIDFSYIYFQKRSLSFSRALLWYFYGKTPTQLLCFQVFQWETVYSVYNFSWSNHVWRLRVKYIPSPNMIILEHVIWLFDSKIVFLTLFGWFKIKNSLNF